MGTQDLQALRPVLSAELLFFINNFIAAFFTVSNCIHYSFDMKSPVALFKELAV